MKQATKYYVVFILLTVSLVLSILFLFYRIYHHDLFHLKQQVVFSLSLVSEKVSNEISGDILVISDALADFVQTPVINIVDANYSRKNLKTLFNQLKEFDVGRIELLNSNGVRITSVSMPGWESPPVAFHQHLQPDEPLLLYIFSCFFGKK